MKTVLFSLIAMLGYASSNVLLEQKLAKFNNLTILMCYTALIFVMATTMRHFTKTEDPSFSFPAGWDLLWMLALCAVWFGADYFYIGAFTTGGSLLTIASIVVMFPVFASIFRFIWVREMPNFYHIGGYVLAVAAILLVAKGNMLLNTPK